MTPAPEAVTGKGHEILAVFGILVLLVPVVVLLVVIVRKIGTGECSKCRGKGSSKQDQIILIVDQNENEIPKTDKKKGMLLPV
nr:hypothetical protein BaRGS_005103 [Batillaria attramentaria]